MSFSKIPPEIQNIIYRVILVSASPITIDGHDAGWDYQTTPAFLRTCKAVHEQAAAIYYTENTFKFRTTEHLWQFLIDIGLEKRSMIRSIECPFS